MDSNIQAEMGPGGGGWGLIRETKVQITWSRKHVNVIEWCVLVIFVSSTWKTKAAGFALLDSDQLHDYAISVHLIC